MSNRVKKISFFALSVLLSGIAIRPATAAIPDFQYVAAGAQSVSSPNVVSNAAAGSTVTVPVYLLASSAGVTLLTNEGGLGTAGFNINRVTSGAAAATISNFTPAETGTDFVGLSSPWTLTTTSVTGGDEGAANGQANGVKLGNDGSPANEIFLGTLSIIAGSSGSSTVFSIGAQDPVNGGSTFTNKDVYDLDLTNNGGSPPPTYNGIGSNLATVTINATPEPASLALLGLGAAGLLLRRRKAANG